ncbi:MAG TPA: hypothetical protein EYP21_00450 [Syntrophaceae bacterium]|nr:hypothetical protein [Syntrophaceae bacterium]
MKKDRHKPIFIANRVQQVFDLIFYGGEFWYHKNGCYRPAEMVIRNFLQTELGKYFSSRFVSEVLYVLQSRCYTKNVKVNPQLISFKNGVYDWIEDKLYSHKEVSDQRFMTQLPVNFNPKAKCTRIDRFLDEVMRPEDKKALLQFIGYCLIPTTRFEKAMMLVGDGANGKSTFLKTLIALIGKSNTSTLSLYDLSHRFRLAEIVGKLVNVFPDLPYKKIQDSSAFKAIVSGDPITAEKKYLKPFTFEPFTKLIFSTNKLPQIQDISHAFFRRWLIVQFPNTFEGDKKDPGLLSQLTTQHELEGLLLLAIEGLNSLYEAEDFAESQGMRDMREEYERMNNPVSVFIDERCNVGPDYKVGKVILYEDFKHFVSNEKLPLLSQIEFNKELSKQIPTLKEISGKERYWRGIAIS